MAIPFDSTLKSLSRDTASGSRSLLVAALLVLLLWLLVAARLPLPLLLESTDGRIVSALQPTRIVAGTEESVAAVFVRLGDHVTHGDPLVRFDQAPLQLELASQQEALTALQRQRLQVRREAEQLGAEQDAKLELLDRSIDRIKARQAETRAAIEYADFQVRTYTTLEVQRTVDALKLQEARALAEQQRQRLRALEIELQEVAAKREVAERGWQAERLRYDRLASTLEGKIASLQPTLERLRHDIAALEIRAPHDGIIEGMAGVSVGQTLPPNAWLMTLNPAGDYQFEARFLATEAAARIKPGAPARIAFSALPWTEYGTLGARVSRVGNEERSRLITVQLELEKEVSLVDMLGYGLTGRAIVEVGRTTLLQRLLNLLTHPSPQ
jgi:multidrug resistance efflux pump